jgi:PAS domain S-box-containing protein
LAFPEDKTYFGPIAQTYAMAALRAGQVVFSDLHRSQFSGDIHLDLVVPLSLPCAPEPAAASAAQRVGVIVIEVDPSRFLYPRILDWPTSSSTAETVLVRREGDEVLYLNDLRHRSNTAMSFRLPVDSTRLLPAAMAAMGQEGVVEGSDYRDVPVLAAIRGIPDSPWFIVAKIDQEEVFATLRERAQTTGIILFGGVLLAALGVVAMLRQHDNRWLRRQLAVERESQLILDWTGEGILGLDAQGRHVFVNLAASKMFGYQPEELIGKSSHATWHSRHPDGSPYPLEECVIYAAMADGREHHCDQEMFWRKDGTRFPVEYTVTPAREKDRSIAAVLTFRDITERKKAAEELRDYAEVLASANQAMEEFARAAEVANQAKSEFLANMSHEIRTPITAILGFTDLFLMGSPPPEPQREYLRAIQRNGQALLELINDILDLSKIEAGKLGVEPTDCPVAQIIDDVLSAVSIRAREKGIALEVEDLDKIPRMIHTDPGRLRQILVNLAGNAVKFTKRGSVRISARLIDGKNGEPSLQFSVTDTGIGISPEKIGELFQPFVQADSSITRHYGGTGLGLAISKRLANSLGGDIEVQSDIGKGSTFAVTIDPGPLQAVQRDRTPICEGRPADSDPSDPGGWRRTEQVLLATKE